jgi:RNA 3'-terminal phosphate cyclase (ATP)
MINGVTVDGSRGEGGGQILRSSLALSLLTGRAVELVNIRANRQKPGLQPQHLTSVRAAARVGCARVEGDAIGSTRLAFEPGPVQPGHYRFDIGTAGATGLVLHTIYLPLALAHGPSKVVVTGGTHVKKAPSATFLEHTWRGWLRRVGLVLDFRMIRAGFYPRGGGVVELDVPGSATVAPLGMGDPAPRGRAVSGISAVAGLDEGIARRMADRAAERLRPEGIKADIRLESWEGGMGAVIALFDGSELVPATFVALGERGKRAERVADEAVEELLAHREHGGVDEHSSDQLVLPLAFAAGASAYPVARVTQHLITNIATVRAFVDREVRCEGDEGQPGRVVIE